MKKKSLSVLLVMCMLILVSCGTGKSEQQAVGESTQEEMAENSIAEAGKGNSGSEEGESTEEESKPSAEAQQQAAGEDDGAEQQAALSLSADPEYANLAESEGFDFESNGDGTCTLTKIGLCADKDIVIPEKSPAGDIVTEIGEYAFYDAKKIESIIFAGKNIELDSNALQSCEFKKLVITGCEITIGSSAFSYCDDITEILISNSELTAEEYAFYDSGDDAILNISNSEVAMEDNSFQSSGIVSVQITDCTGEIGENAFSYCEDITNMTISGCTLSMEEYAFYDSGDDMVVSFSDSDIELEDNVFQASMIVSFDTSNGKLTMGSNTFSYCDDLAAVSIAGEYTEIGEYAFYDCESLEILSIAGNAETECEITIKDNAFQSCGLVSVIIGDGTVRIGDNGFSYCEKLETVTIGNGSLSVGDYAFYGCPDALEITYGGNSYNKLSIEDL